MFATTQKNLAPFIGAGGAAIPNLQNLLGNGPQGAAGEEQALAATPGYQFQLGQGLQGILSNATATGGVGGGNTLKALMGYGQGLADQTYQQSVGNQMGLAQLGENAAAGQGGISANVGGQIGQNIIGAGNVQSAGLVGAGSAAQGGIQNFLLSQLLNGGGGGLGGVAPTAEGNAAVSGLI